MMFGCSPPLTMTPWSRASGRSCCRMASSVTNSWITALSAFTPRHGQLDAWAAAPKNSALTLMMPRLGRQTRVPPRPWIIMAASTSRKTPASINRTLPAPPSSAGVPITWISPANGSVPSATANAAPAPVPAVAMTLWPHACPIPGNASYSAMIATRGPGPVPGMVARNAVGSPPTPRSTRSPRFSRKSVSQPWAFSSLKQSSGFAWICSDSFSSSSAKPSTAAMTRVLVSSSALMRPAPLEVLLHASEQAGVAEQIDGGHRHGLGRGQQALAGEGSDRRRLEGARVDGRTVGSDLHQWLDGRHHLAHVADVRRTEAVLHLRRFRDAQCGDVRAPDRQERLVALHRLVGVLVIDDLHGASRRTRGALRTGDDAPVELPHLVDPGRTDVKRGGRKLGNDVRRGAALGDDAVDPTLGTNLLTQHADRVEGPDDGVERVDPLPRIGRRVCSLSGELEADAHDAEQILMGDPTVPAVHHQRRVDALEDAAAYQLHLTAAALLGRRADDVDPALRKSLPDGGQAHACPGAGRGGHGVTACVADAGAAAVLGRRADDVDPARRKSLPDGGQAHACPGAGRGDHVVTACVADAGERVVLTHDGDRGPIACVQGGSERGIDPGDAALHLEAPGAEKLDEPAGGFDFLVPELGMIVDLPGELFQLVACPVQRTRDLILDGAHARTSVGGVRARQLYTVGRVVPSASCALESRRASPSHRPSSVA